MAQYKNIDIIPDSTVNRIHLSQGDVGRTLIFYLFENALSWSVPSNSTIKCQGTKPSGFGFSVSCTYSGNAVTCVTTDEMTDEYGQIEAELVITSSDESQVFGTSNFILDIEKNPHPDGTVDGNAENPVIANLEAVITQAVDDWLDEHPEATTTVVDGSITEPKLANSLATKINNKADTTALTDEATTRANADTALSNQIAALQGAVGSPLVAPTVADMTDTTKIYVYTGSETNYTAGNWYYYNGSAWVSGGVYNAVAVNTDTTLSVSGMPADAKATGDNLSDLNDNVERGLTLSKTSLTKQAHKLSPTYVTSVDVLNPALGTKIPFSYYDGTSKITNGITFTVDEHGVITANGSATSNAFFKIWDNGNRVKFPFDEEVVTMSVVSDAPVYFYLNYNGNDEKKTNKTCYQAITFTTKSRNDYTYLNGGVYIASGDTVYNCKIYPLIEYGDTAHNYVYVSSNKNLINLDYIESGSSNGIDYTVDHTNGTILLDGMATANVSVAIELYSIRRKPFNVGDIVRLSGTPNTSVSYRGIYLYCNTKDSSNVTLQAIQDYNGSATLVEKDYYGLSIGFIVQNGVTCDNVLLKPQLEIAQRSTSFVVGAQNSFNPMFGGQLEQYEDVTNVYTKPAYNSSIVCKLSLRDYTKKTFANNPIKFNVCTYNVGLWNYGDRTDSGYDGDDVESKVNALKAMVANNNIDIMCMQEYTDYFDRDETISATDSVFKPVFADYFVGFSENMLFTKYNTCDTFKNHVGDTNSVGYLMTKYVIDCREIYLVNTHLSYDNLSARTEQIADLAGLLADKDYVILCGDLNIETLSELDPLINIGLKPANHGYFGTFHTVKNNNTVFYDNILVSEKIIISNAKMLDTDNVIPSDHYPLLTSLVVPGEKEAETEMY